MKPKWIREGRTIYALNANGHNAFLVTVGRGCMCDKCGPYDDQKSAECSALAELIFALPEMAGALKRLANEVSANLGPFETDLRAAIGNTNFAVLLKRVAEARALLERIQKETP